MDFSTGVSYLQNLTQHKKIELVCENRYSMRQGHDSP